MAEAIKNRDALAAELRDFEGNKDERMAQAKKGIAAAEKEAKSAFKALQAVQEAEQKLTLQVTPPASTPHPHPPRVRSATPPPPPGHRIRARDHLLPPTRPATSRLTALPLLGAAPLRSWRTWPRRLSRRASSTTSSSRSFCTTRGE